MTHALAHTHHTRPYVPLLRRHPPANSIYVTASNASTLSADSAQPEGQGGSDAGSGNASPRHLSSPRQLSPPWALPGHHGASSPRGAAERPLLQNLDSLEQLQEEVPAAVVRPPASPLAAELERLHLSEEEALQRALEMSLADARQQQQGEAVAGQAEGQQQQQADETARGGGSAPPQQAQAEQEQADAAAALAAVHTRTNPTFRDSSSGGDGRRNPLYGGSGGGEAPHSTCVFDAAAVAAGV